MRAAVIYITVPKHPKKVRQSRSSFNYSTLNYKTKKANPSWWIDRVEQSGISPGIVILNMKNIHAVTKPNTGTLSQMWADWIEKLLTREIHYCFTAGKIIVDLAVI